MTIFIYKNNEQTGPFTKDQIAEFVAAGTFLADDHAWMEGIEDWQPLKTIVPEVFTTKTAAPPARPPAPPATTNSNADNSTFGSKVGSVVRKHPWLSLGGSAGAAALCLGPLAPVGIAAAAGLVWNEKRKEKNAQHEAFMKLLGHTDERLYFENDGTAIGVNTTTQKLVLRNKDNIKAYDFDSVGAWETNSLTGGMMVGGGMQSLGSNIGTAIRNKNMSGLFITINGDLDNLQWRIDMQDKSLQDKWMALLSQAINKRIKF